MPVLNADTGFWLYLLITLLVVYVGAYFWYRPRVRRASVAIKSICTGSLKPLIVTSDNRLRIRALLSSLIAYTYVTAIMVWIYGVVSSHGVISPTDSVLMTAFVVVMGALIWCHIRITQMYLKSCGRILELWKMSPY